MSTDSPLTERPAGELLELVIEAEIRRTLRQPLTRAEALGALAARAELLDRLARFRWLAIEQARAVGASWAEIDATVGLLTTGSARDEYEAALARQRAYGLIAPDRRNPGPAEPATSATEAVLRRTSREGDGTPTRSEQPTQHRLPPSKS